MFQARAALGSVAAATSAALPNRAAYSRPNTFEQKRTAASTCDCRKARSGLSSLAEAFKQCLCAVVEILPKFRQGPLRHFVDRQFASEISANTHELNQGLHFSHFISDPAPNLAGFLSMVVAAAVAVRDRALILFLSRSRSEIWVL